MCRACVLTVGWAQAVCIRICGSQGRLRMRESPREAMHGDVMCLVGACGALVERIATASDVPACRAALFSDV